MQRVEAKLPKELCPENIGELVRIGGQNDGGYIISSEAIGKIKSVLTFGLGYNWAFESELAANFEINNIHCYDHTVGATVFRKKYYFSLLNIFEKKQKRAMRQRAYKNYSQFFEKTDGVRHYKLRVGAIDVPGQISLQTALSKLNTSQNDVLLKCDIEGSEYEIADAVIAKAGHFPAIAIEFHDVGRNLDELTAILRRLKSTHRIDHIHANSLSKINASGIPSVIEVSLSRLDLKQRTNFGLLGKQSLKTAQNGTELDCSNVPDRADIILVYV
jgi:hypothetical protein